MIEMSGLSYAAGGKAILHDITARLPEGRLTVLVGPNGAGKSTLLALLGRHLAPGGGVIRFGGRPLEDWPRAELARALTILRQATRITPRLTVADLVAFGRYPHGQGRLTPEDRKIAAACLDRMALTDLRDRQLDTLSGGQQQRALIAMVLAQDTGTLLMDEPLNNLDLAHARRVMQVLRERAAAGRTVVAVLHDLTVAARYADHVLALRDGRVMAEGPPDAVFTPARLAQLYDAEIEVHQIGGRPVILPI